jgi:hypothetical protein
MVIKPVTEWCASIPTKTRVINDACILQPVAPVIARDADVPA